MATDKGASKVFGRDPTGRERQMVFSTSDAARICRVAPRTVAKWFDAGKLKGYRIPGSNDRRIPRECLLRFLRDHNMPLNELEAEESLGVLLVGLEPQLLAEVEAALAAVPDCRTCATSEAFEAGVLAEAFRPRAVVVNLGMGRSEGLAIARALRNSRVHRRTRAVVIVNDDETDLHEIAGVCHGWVRRPVNVTLLVGLLTADEMPSLPEAAQIEAEACVIQAEQGGVGA